MRLTEDEYSQILSRRSRTARVVRPSTVKEWIPVVRDEKELLEVNIQAHLIEWADHADNQYLYPGLDMLYSVPNGSGRGKTEAWVHKMTGLRSGIPDLVLPVARQPFFGLCVELKTYKAYHAKGHSLSANQVIWIDKLRKAGQRVEVLWSLSEVIQLYRDYLGKRILD